MRHLDELFALCKGHRTCAVAQAADRPVLEACVMAKARNLASFILCGDKAAIEAGLKDLGEDAGAWDIRHQDSPQACAAEAVRLARDGEASLLMKGLLSTSILMRAVLDREKGIRGPGLLSHVMAYEVPSCPRILFNTDGGLNTFPNAEQKAMILENAIGLLHRLGYISINAALIAGSETVDPKIQATLDAQKICAQQERWESLGCNVYGPVGLDLAISKDACAHKGYEAKGAGEADILLVPTYEVGNAMGKALTYFANAQSAGIIVGAACPIVLVSRSDSAMTKLHSIAMALA